MREKSNNKVLRSLFAGVLALVLALSPVLSNLPALTIQAEAADSKIWYHVETGSGNGNAHTYSEASTSPAAVLLNTEKMTSGGTFEVTYEKQGTPSEARLGFFYMYLDDNNFLYVGYDSTSHWYYEYKIEGSSSTQYASISELSDQADGSRTTISLSLSNETLTVTVNDETAKITNQNFITLASNVGENGRFGFRAGCRTDETTAFHFTDAKLNNQAVTGNWEFLADCAGQTFTQEDPVPLYSVSGLVQDQSGKAIEGATVRIGSESTTTDANGAYSVDVEAGTYDVAVSAAGFAAATKTVTVSADATIETFALSTKTTVTYDKYIESGVIKAAVSEKFPQVMQYILNDNGTQKVMQGQDTALNTIKINGTSITPSMTSVTINKDNAVYVMALKKGTIDLSMTVKISVSDNDLTWEVTDITKNDGCAKINTIEVPNLNLVTISDDQSDTQFKGATISGDTTKSGDVEITFSSGFTANASSGYAYGFLSADGVSAGVWSNSEMASDKRLLRNNGANTISLTSNIWYYEYGDLSDSANYDGTPVSDLPCAKVCLAADENDDGVVDWQDGAIEYRDIMNNPYGYEEVKDLVNYRISMNFSSQATNPYLKTADNIKKVYLATDGLGQAVMLKGYGSEGHDSANSEYGNIAERLGGVEELQELNTIAHQYNTQIGIHVNAQEVYPEAQSFTDELINGTSNTGWGWLDQSYTINRTYDLGTGLRYKRFLQLYDQLNGTSLYANKWPGVAGQGSDETVADAETIASTVAANKSNEEVTGDLDFIYLDVWYGDSWETRKIAAQVNSLGWRFSTEFGTEGEYDSTWQHWATEGSYGGSSSKGINSEVIRFIRNHQKDSFVLNWPSYGGTADNPLLGGYDLSGFEGWGSNNNFDSYMTKTFAINLPTKFLQHYEVTKWVDYTGVDGDVSPTGNPEKEITLKDDDGNTVVVTRNETQRKDDFVERTITLNGRVVLNDVTYLLPWTDSETDEVKLYHYNYDGGTTTWELPDDWKTLGTVKMYKLTDEGRTEEQTILVSGGKVVLTAEADTPYIVVKGEEAAKTVDNWSEYAHVTDTGFNSYSDGQSLDTSVWTGDTSAVSVVRVESGNKYLKMGSTDATQTVSTTITDLTPGTNYVAQVYVDNKSDAKAWIKVTGGAEDVSNYTLKSLAGNYVRCDAHNVNAVSNSKMQNMLVSFTATGTTATLTLEREAGSGETYFDDIRIVEKTLNNIQEDGSFVQDFETVVGGLYPFVMGPAQGVDDQVTHLSELNAPYTQSGWGNVVLDDVISGNWSLKHHGSTSGIIYRTIPQNLHLEAGVTYTVSFDYQAGCADSYYIVVGDGDDVTQSYSYLNKTAAASTGSKSTTESFTFQITGSESGQSWFGLASTGATESGSYGQKDFVLDNLKVEKAKLSISESSIVADSAKDVIKLKASFTDAENEGNEIVWSSSDENVAKVDSEGNVYFVGFGDATITAKAVINGSESSVSCDVSLPSESQKKATFVNTWTNTEETSGEEGYALNVTDGDSSTIWHSQWSGSAFAVSETNPAVITVQIAEDVSEFDTIAILQRSGSNGLVQKYECIVGDSFDASTNTIGGTDGVDRFTTGTVTSTNSSSGSTETISLPSGAKGHYLQIRVLQGANNFASIADLLFTSTVSNATAEELGYIEANKTAFAAAEAAEATSYTAAKESLTTAIAALDAAYAAGQGSYTDESWAAFEKAYLAAKAGLTSANYSSTLATLQTKLEAAKAGLAVKQTTSDSTVKDPVTQTPVNDANNGTTLKVGDTVTKGGVVYKVTNVAKKTAAAVKGKNAKAKSVKIADTVTINGVSCKVTQINAKAFKNYTSLKKVTIGKNVTTIGKQSFYNCKKLAKVTFKGTAVKSIKSGAFKKTSDKLKITLAKSLKGKKRTKLTKLLKKAGISKKATIK